jgi:hypothetical protein
MKHVGPVSWNIFEAVGIKIVRSPAALARSMQRSCWQTRRQSFMLPVHEYPPAA